MNRPKSGFSLPMTQWLSSVFQEFDWSTTPFLAPAQTPWARRWASVVITRYLESCGSPLAREEGDRENL
ncbi:MAG TPA: hypothetical protein VGI45_17135 [Terracidiphilus sp.]